VATGIVEYNQVDTELREWLATALGKQIGLCRIPATDNNRDELGGTELKYPYAILIPMTSPLATGSWAQPEEDRELVYQLTCVGKDPRQARWMSDKVRIAFTARDDSGYVVPMNLTTLTAVVQCRTGESVGAVIAGGVDLYQTNDMYRIYVGA